MNNQKSMLIVGDMESNREIISASFSGEYTVWNAADRMAAIRIVSESDDSVAIIFLDMTAPNVNDVAFLQWLTGSGYGHIPVIAVTCDQRCPREALQNGAWDFIAVPLEKEILIARVRNVLSRSAFEEERRHGKAASAGKYDHPADVMHERETQKTATETQEVLDDLRQQAQDALENYQSLVNAVPGGIVQYEVQGKNVLTRYFSDGICKLTGCSREERERMCNQNVLSVTYAEDANILWEAIQNAVSKKESINITYRINTKSGTPRWVHLSAAYSRGKHGEILYQAVFTDVDKLKRIEQELTENQMRYEVAIKSSGINIWEYDIVRDSLYVVSNSPRIKQNCFHIDHYIQSTLHNGYVREDSIDRFLSIFERLRNGARELTEDIWYKTTDETGWWCERITYTTTFDNAGKPVKAFGAGRDITREKEAEKKFQEEISYRKAIQSDNLASIVMDLTSNQVLEIDSTCQTVLDLAGVTADTYFDKTAQKIVGDQMIAQFTKSFSRKALLNQFGSGEFVAAMELTRLYDTSKVYWVNYSVHLIQNPETKHIIAHISCVDITREKVMQTVMETVSKTDYDFFVIVDGSSDSAQDYGIIDGQHLFAEKDSFETNMERMVREEVCAEDVERVISTCKIDNIWSHIKNGEIYKFNFSIFLPNGEIRRKQMQFTAISPTRKTYLMSRIDVSSIYEEQELAKRKLQKALSDAEQANRVKTDFLSRMSHDIRTPMNAVMSLAALGQDSNSIEEARDYLRKISTSGQYLLAIINDVLNLSKLEHQGLQLHPETVNLPKFIQETLSIVMPTAKEKNIDLQVKQIRIDSQYVKLDTTYVRQVVVNLLSNAIKFTPSGGRVDLILESISRKGQFVRNRMIIKDTGIGIGKEFLSKLFTPFEQENTQNDLARQGTGLGLSIVKGIVEQMGGKIWAESEQGHGSSFYVEWTFETVPIEKVQRLPPAPTAASHLILSGKKVLLCEDHPLNAEIARKLLEKQGILAEHAANGKLALEQFSRSPIGYYDAILMDIRMPLMNGLDATRAIRALRRPDAKSVPIIAMTANAFDEDVQKSISAGMNAHLAKPIEPQQLYDTLADFISNRRSI